MRTQTKLVMTVAAYLGTFLLTVVSGAIIGKPLNVATNVGDQAIFNCSSDSTIPITWLYSKECNTFAGTQLTVDNNCEIKSDYASNYRTEQLGASICNLIVNVTAMSFGQCYICADGIAAGRLSQAMLIVVDSNATITANYTDLIPGDSVMISSNVSYGGPSIPSQPPPLPPSFYWTLLSNPNQNITSYPGSTTDTSSSSYVIETVTTTEVPHYEVTLFFNPPSQVLYCASNAPSYSTSWVTPTYPVSYEPVDISISGASFECTSDEIDPITLICNASGYPPPTYEWFEITKPGDILSFVSELTIQTNGIYQCNASNIIKGVKHSISTVANISGCVFLPAIPLSTEMCDAPRDISISGVPSGCTSEGTDSITIVCNAFGYPPPTYEWNEINNPGHVLSSESELKIQTDGIYQCTASNIIKNVQYSISTVANVSVCR